MKYALVAAVALVLGILLGGVPTRGDVRRLESEVAELEERDCRPMLGTGLLGALRPAAVPPGVDPEPVAPSGDTDEAAAPEVAAPDEELDEESIETVRATLDVRRAQARAALLEQANPTEEQLESFDAAVADMNAELRSVAEDLLARVHELDGVPPRRELMLYAADGLDAVIEADARIQETLGGVAVDDEAVDPLSHLDPSLVDLLAELDELEFDEGNDQGDLGWD